MKFVTIASALTLFASCAKPMNGASKYCGKTAGINNISAHVYYPYNGAQSQQYLVTATKAVETKYKGINWNEFPKPTILKSCSSLRGESANEIKVSWIKFKQPMSNFGGIELEKQLEVAMTTKGIVTKITSN